MTQVEGLEYFKRRWDRIPEAVRAEVTGALEALAKEIVADMRRLAPKDEGDLAASIDWTWGDAPAGSLSIGSVDGRAYGALSLTIYAGGEKEFYARFQEFGTVNMPANPFFFPIWRAWKPEVKRRINRAITRALKKA